MKKKVLFITVLVLAVLMLSACNSKEEAAGETVIIPAETTYAPVVTIAPTPEPIGNPITIPSQEPAPMPTPEPTPAPTPVPTIAPAAAPVSSNLPRITKDPASERVAVNGKCQFVTRYENAKLAEWHFISPDGSRDLDYKQMQSEYPSMNIINGYTKDMTLERIPAALNGWKVYCRFSNDYGAVNSNTALITVDQTQIVNPPSVSYTSYDGRWAGELASRCTITFSSRGGGSYNVDITWSSSAYERACWKMTANPYSSDMIAYQDGHYWVETYSDNTNYTISQESFGLTGSFYIIGNRLYWFNNQTGEEIAFIRA